MKRYIKSSSYDYKGYKIYYLDSTVYIRDRYGNYHHFDTEKDAEEYIDEITK